LNSTPLNNSAEYFLQNVATSTFSVPTANLTTDFTTPRNNSRTVLLLNPPPPSVGGVAEAPSALGSSAAVSASSSGGTNRIEYGVVGAAAAVVALGAGVFVYRRRTA
jgi:hypothetical protein